MTEDPDDPREWVAYTERLLGDQIEDPDAKPKTLNERVRNIKNEDRDFQRAWALVKFVGRSFTTAAFVAFGAFGVMIANYGLAETFPAMPPGIGFVNSLFLFVGTFVGYVVLRKLAHG